MAGSVYSGMSDLVTASIRVVHPEDQSAGTAQTVGSQRKAAIPGALGVASGMWAGTFLVEAGAKTGIHHHGAQETVVYVLAGEALVRWGERGEQSATVRVGDFVHVPAWVAHQEINPSATEAFRWVVVRSTPEPIVVNLPDAVWE